MKVYDWIVVGGGMTGAALSYELARQGLSVLLLEQHSTPDNATCWSYGGIPYWSATTPLTRQLYAETKTRYATLSEELNTDLQFRELDLLLTVPSDSDPQAAAILYAQCEVPPQPITVSEACALEPLLNPGAIAGALTIRHGHISPSAVIQGYLQSFLKTGGTLHIAKVSRLEAQRSGTVTLQAGNDAYTASQVVVCAGGLTRSLLQTAGIVVPLYFTHAELVDCQAGDVQLRTLIMPAQTTRFQMEAQASTAVMDARWETAGTPLVPPILDAGAVQFLDGTLRIGQISRIDPDWTRQVDAAESERAMRAAVGQILPVVQHLPGTWHHCLVSFSRDRLPLIGHLSDAAGIHVFAGFSSPWAIVPTLAQRFAQQVMGQPDEYMAQLSPERFQS